MSKRLVNFILAKLFLGKKCYTVILYNGMALLRFSPYNK